MAKCKLHALWFTLKVKIGKNSSELSGVIPSLISVYFKNENRAIRRWERVMHMGYWRNVLSLLVMEVR